MSTGLPVQYMQEWKSGCRGQGIERKWSWKLLVAMHHAGGEERGEEGDEAPPACEQWRLNSSEYVEGPLMRCILFGLGSAWV